MLLLFKHITDADIIEKLPGIITLFDDLLKEESGLRNLETVLRYLATTVENVTPDEMKTVINNALVDGKGDIIMTLADQWIQEGFQKGIHQGMQEGMQKGCGKACSKVCKWVSGRDCWKGLCWRFI